MIDELLPPLRGFRFFLPSLPRADARGYVLPPLRGSGNKTASFCETYSPETLPVKTGS